MKTPTKPPRSLPPNSKLLRLHYHFAAKPQVTPRKPHKEDAGSELTEEQLDALIAEQSRPENLPPWWGRACDDQRHGRTFRPEQSANLKRAWKKRKRKAKSDRGESPVTA